MLRNIKYFIGICLVALIWSSCQEDDADFGTVTVPTNLRAEAIIADDQSGNVTVTPTADNALTSMYSFNREEILLLLHPENL